MSAIDALNNFDKWAADDFLKPDANSSLVVYEVRWNHLIWQISQLPPERQPALKAALRELDQMLRVAIRRELVAAARDEAQKVLEEK
jgi:hypothetical protein